MVCLVKYFSKWYDTPGSTHDHGGDRLQGKVLYAGQVITGGDWALVLPTLKLDATSQQSPENFVQIGQCIQKLFMIFQNTDTHKQTTPVPYTGTGKKNVCPVFLYLFTLLAHSVLFRINCNS